MKFVLEIELGNDAMRTGDDIAKALRHLSARLIPYRKSDLPGASGRVGDVNGNTVGRWLVEEE